MWYAKCIFISQTGFLSIIVSASRLFFAGTVVFPAVSPRRSRLRVIFDRGYRRPGSRTVRFPSVTMIYNIVDLGPRHTSAHCFGVLGVTETNRRVRDRQSSAAVPLRLTTVKHTGNCVIRDVPRRIDCRKRRAVLFISAAVSLPPPPYLSPLSNAERPAKTRTLSGRDWSRRNTKQPVEIQRTITPLKSSNSCGFSLFLSSNVKHTREMANDEILFCNKTIYFCRKQQK